MGGHVEVFILQCLTDKGKYFVMYMFNIKQAYPVHLGHKMYMCINQDPRSWVLCRIGSVGVVVIGVSKNANEALPLLACSHIFK